MPSQGWKTLHNESALDRHALLGGGWKVKARRRGSADNGLWLNIQMPDGLWTYIVLDEDGSILHQEFAPTKKECYERPAAALRALEAAT